ncbi:MAG: GH36-type glycosyl hydrolase domain-containing protein [Eubacteriales bacterium]
MSHIKYRRMTAKLIKRLGDNAGFDILEEKIRSALKSYHKHKTSERLVSVLHRMLEEYNYKIDSSQLESSLIRAQNGYYFDNDELYAVNDTIVLLILEKLSDDKQKNTETLLYENCIHTLQMLDIYDFMSLFEHVSYIERLLLDDENSAFSDSDEPTKQIYRNNIARYAKKHKLSQTEAARRMYKNAADLPEHHTAKKLYFYAVYTLTAFIFLLTLMLSDYNLVPVLFCILPITEFSKQIADFIFRFCVPAVSSYKLKIIAVPSHAKTLVVITTLLFGEKRDSDIFDRLERYYLANRGACLYGNVGFGILGDLRDSDNRETAEDTEILAYASHRIKLLNEKYNGCFYLFVRSRILNKTENRYMGWERKRGAVIELVKKIKNIKTSITTFIGDNSFICDLKYVFTLDADTNLGLDTVSEMVGAMLHPQNKPVIREGIVVKGHAVMQPRMDISLDASCATPFTLMQTGGGGIDIYSSAVFDVYQSVFGEGIFCGKGIFDVEIFSNLISNTFPDGCVLSHDLLEGSYLRARYLGETALTDSCPKNPASSFDRLHRWIRGDIQALAFAKKPLNSLSRYKLYDNLRRILVPVFSVFSLLLTVFYPWDISKVIITASLAYLMLPFFITLIMSVKHMSRRFFSRLVPAVWHSFFNMLYNISSLFHLAQVSTDAVIRSLYRMKISRRRMLEWVTASESDNLKRGGPVYYLVKMLPSVIIGLVLLIFVPNGFYKILGFLWILLPFISYFIGCAFHQPSLKASEHQTEMIRSWANDMWRYFDDLVKPGDNHLPPDNFQMSPSETAAHRTSPTNIGLYMLSCLAARDFGFINDIKLFTRLKNTCETLERMTKWNGHLYNWYDTRTLEVLGTPYVSTVDSGNLITSLVALREGLKEYIISLPDFNDIIVFIDSFISAANFEPLYNKTKKLFHIGYDALAGLCGEIYYDLFMSEVRTACYYTAAIGAISSPKEMWRRLRRPLISADGYIGLASWSGTMFEYFMPALLLPVKRGSMSWEALKFAFRVQRSLTVKGLWGRSESGYYAFDSEMNYQYKAFGAARLGLKRGLENDCVISPYSSFLSLAVSVNASVANLRRLESFGLYGKYGFFEAVDFTPSRVGHGHAQIRSYMAHHIGMSIIACANVCYDGIMRRRFMRDPYMACAAELLEERVPLNASVKKRQVTGTQKPNIRHIRTGQSASSDFNLLSPKTAMISNNKCKLTASSSGDIFISDGFAAVTFPYFNKYDIKKSLRLCFSVDGNIQNIVGQRFSYSEDYIKYTKISEGINANAVFTVHGSLSCINISLFVEGAFSEICPLLYFEPVLTRFSDYNAHPAFSDLSIDSEFDSVENILFYRRRPRLENERMSYLAVTLETASGGVEFETRRDNLFGLNYSSDDVDAVCGKRLSCNTGACIIPACAIQKRSVSRHGKYRCDFLLSYAHSRTEAAAIIKTIRGMRHTSSGGLTGIFKRSVTDIIKSRLAIAGLTGNEIKYAELVLSCICYDLNPSAILPQPPKENLWQYGISGDLPLITLYLSFECFKGGKELIENIRSMLENFIRTHRYHTVCGMRYDLVLLCTETEKYGSPRLNSLLDLIYVCGGELLMGRKGGIHVLNGDRNLFKQMSRFYYEPSDSTVFTCIYHEYMTPREIITYHTVPITHIQNPICEKSHFNKDSFTVIKGEQRVPWSYIYCNRYFGTIITQNSLGYTWLSNSKEGRLTPNNNDILLGSNGERLIASVDGAEYDLCAVSSGVDYKRDSAIYSGSIGSFSYNIRVGVDRRLPAKLITINAAEKNLIRIDITPDNTAVGAMLFIHEPVKGSYIIGTAVSNILKNYIISKFKTETDINNELNCYGIWVKETLGGFELKTESAALDEMMNFYLPYQAIFCRILARCGFYQSGGAYGFRDQLQDCLSALYFNPSLVRVHLIRCASRQYTEGDVMHWWHGGKKPHGVRTRCSDDLLWLPYVTAEYITRTGDATVLDILAPYVISPPLSDCESERYEYPERSDLRESLYHHCLRAIEKGMRFGKHKLPLIGSCDWNDGFSHVGIEGRGESVWLAYFLRLVLRSFIPVCERMGDNVNADRYRHTEVTLANNIEQNAWDGSWYLRGYYDDGAPLGSSESNECKIDALPQAFAGILDGKNERSAEASENAYNLLYDSEYKLYKLFTPAFDLPERNPGYISGYVPGVRENGGQYSHAAVWAVWGLLAINENERAYELLTALNPAVRFGNDALAAVYRAEPYALAGDVYSNEDHRGRGGWSLYTGAAAWYYRITLEEFLGYHENGESFTLEPRLSCLFYKFNLKINRHESEYMITVNSGTCNQYILDGTIVNNKFLFDRRKHFLEITVAK